MTEEYKNKLLKYLTGNIEEETGTNEPQFVDGGTVNSNIKTYVNNYFQYGSSITGTVTVNNSDYYLSYGFYYYNQAQTDMRGFVLIIGNNHIPVQMITEFDSGTSLKPFSYLTYDEDGYIYGVDKEYDPTGGSSGTVFYKDFRFIMLNKILYNQSGTFVVKLRKSYNFSSTYASSILNVYNCTKQINTSNYFFFVESTGSNFGVLSLDVNVGEGNEWKFVTTNLINISSEVVFFNDYTSTNFKIIISGTVTIYPKYYNYREVVYEYSDTPTITELNTISSPDFTTTSYSMVSMVRLSYQDTYLIYNESTTNDDYYFYKVNYSNNSLELIESFTVPTGYNSAEFQKIGNLPFFKLYWRVEENSTYVVKSYLGLIIGKNVYYMSLQDVLYTEFTISYFINQNFNLYEIYNNINNNQSQIVQIIYNVNNYNGLSYESKNCIVPNSGILRDENDKIIFARNLYNKTILGAVTTSTLQIPNTMLNDATISENDLISVTNASLTEDTTDITKNVYETVNINFANSISIKNDNDINNEILNPVASARLNGSTTQAVDYEDAYAGKLRVNYSDGTNMIITLNPSVNILFLTTTSAQYDFIIYVSKQIDTIEIISMDEVTSYQTISNLNFEIGKIYQITQKVEVQ